MKCWREKYGMKSRLIYVDHKCWIDQLQKGNENCISDNVYIYKTEFFFYHFFFLWQNIFRIYILEFTVDAHRENVDLKPSVSVHLYTIPTRYIYLQHNTHFPHNIYISHTIHIYTYFPHTIYIYYLYRFPTHYTQ